VREADLTYNFCRKVGTILSRNKNYKVLYTRGSGESEARSDEQRTAFANENLGDLLVSLQCGALLTPEISRAEVFYMNPLLDAPLSPQQERQESISQLASWNQAYKAYVSDSVDLGREINRHLQNLYKVTGIIRTEAHPRPGRFGIMRGLAMPGVIVELGNLAHPQTASFLSSERTQNEIAQALAIAVSNYLIGQTGNTALMGNP
jgi:N-acetylmuramoyl-L-alanine amidase